MDVETKDVSVLNVVSHSVGNLVSTTVRALADKKITWAEGFGVLKALGALAYNIFANRAALRVALSDGIDCTEKTEFKNGFSAGFVLNDSELEQSVEHYTKVGADLLVAIANLFLLDKPTTVNK